jgi:DNA-binding transcriptional MerR regulator
MATYTIGEIAARSGFTPSALRYYEGIGLMASPARSNNGYRIYDDRARERLAFIARAKRSGCSLEEIADLVEIWEGERCEPVQRRFQGMVTDKIRRAERQIAELATRTAQLESVVARLGGDPVDGPCGDECACLGDAASWDPGVASWDPGVASHHPEPRDRRITCRLEPDAIEHRLARWREMLGHASSGPTLIDGGIRVAFGRAVRLDKLARLVAAEHRCCAFFSFTITSDANGLALDVRAPDAAKEIVASVFGCPEPVRAGSAQT